MAGNLIFKHPDAFGMMSSELILSYTGGQMKVYFDEKL